MNRKRARTADGTKENADPTTANGQVDAHEAEKERWERQRPWWLRVERVLLEAIRGGPTAETASEIGALLAEAESLGLPKNSLGGWRFEYDAFRHVRLSGETTTAERVEEERRYFLTHYGNGKRPCAPPMLFVRDYGRCCRTWEQRCRDAQRSKSRKGAAPKRRKPRR